MAIVLRVEHGTLPRLNFTDDEVIDLDMTSEQRNVTELSQTGSLSIVYLGDELMRFNISFRIFLRETIEKLDRIHQLQDEFTVFPFLLEAPASSYTVLWPRSEMRERWVRGRMRANWDLPVIWRERRVGSCGAGVS